MRNRKLLLISLFIITVFIRCDDEPVTVIEPCEEEPAVFQTVFNLEYESFNSYASCTVPKAYVIRTQNELNSIIQNCTWNYPVDFEEKMILANNIVVPHYDFTTNVGVSVDTLLDIVYFSITAQEDVFLTSLPLLQEKRINRWILIDKIPLNHRVFFNESIVYQKDKYQ